ncbi:MAG: hypothetical protein R2764_23130 [Bacteroidales bacterium]
MFKNLTYKKKLQLIFIGALVMLFVVYHMAISKTLNRRSQCKELQGQLVTIENAPTQMAEIHSELTRIGKIIGKENNKEDFRQKILEETTKFCENNKIRINEIPEPVVIDKNDYEIYTHTLVLEGDFQNLVRYIYELEQNLELSNVTSAKFYSAKEVRTKQKKLYLKLFIQNIQKQK